MSREILSLDELVTEMPARACALTFDDGRRSIVEVVHPILRRNRTPYTVFICTEAANGGPVPWYLRVQQLMEALGLEPLRAEWHVAPELGRGRVSLMTALKEVPQNTILSGLDRLERIHGIAPPPADRLFLQSDEIRDLALQEVSIQAHSHTHPILSKLSREAQRVEIETSRDELVANVGVRPKHFAYPNGTPKDFNDVTSSLLREAGFTHAFTTVQRHLSSSSDELALPRIGITSGESPLRRTLKELAPWLARSQATEARTRTRANQAAGTGTT
jgi:peptidoglycan/xylan/chitin deacetylase (PgdA/CDA1 family)